MLDDQDRVARVDESLEHLEEPTDILEVKARRRLVEDVEGPPGLDLAELAAELDPLGLTSAHRRRRLADLHVAQADVQERLEDPPQLAVVGEELCAVADAEPEHLRDRVAAVAHRQGRRVVALALADVAGDVDVGEEVHLDLDDPVAATGLAASPLDVEGEAPGLPPAGLGLRELGEDRPDLVKGLGVGAGVGPRCPTDRALVDGDHLVERLEPLDLAMGPDPPGAPVEHPHQRRQEDAVDQRALSRTAHAGDRDQRAQGQLDVDLLEVVLGGPADPDPPLRGPSLRRHLDRPTAADIGPGDALHALADLGGGTAVDHATAEMPRPRAEVDHVIGGLDRVLVVLDDEDRIAEVAEPLEGADKPLIVALMEADARLVEHVHHPAQLRSELRRQADPLGLAAAQGRPCSVEGQVVEADVDQELEAVVDLPHRPLSDRLLRAPELQAAEVLGRVADVLAGHLVDAEARDPNREALGPEAASVTGLAGPLDEVLAVVVASVLRSGLLEAPLEVGDHPLKAHPPGALGDRSFAADLDRDLPLADPVEHLVLLALAELRPRHVEIHLAGLGHRLDDPVGPALAAVHRRGPRGDRPRADAHRRIGDDQLRVDVEAGAEAVALGAHAERRVEGEALRAQLREREPTAGPGLGEAEPRPALLDRLRPQLALALAQPELDGLGDPLAVALADRQAVDH